MLGIAHIHSSHPSLCLQLSVSRYICRQQSQACSNSSFRQQQQPAATATAAMAGTGKGAGSVRDTGGLAPSRSRSPAQTWLDEESSGEEGQDVRAGRLGHPAAEAQPGSGSAAQPGAAAPRVGCGCSEEDEGAVFFRLAEGLPFHSEGVDDQGKGKNKGKTKGDNDVDMIWVPQDMVPFGCGFDGQLKNELQELLGQLYFKGCLRNALQKHMPKRGVVGFKKGVWGF